MKPVGRLTVVAVLLSLGACSSGDGGGGANLPASVVSRIEAETNCPALQREFDNAEANRAINGERAVAYMKMAEDRMREIGCDGG